MAKSKIERRLSVYFVVVLVLFALVVGGLFSVLFNLHMKRVYRDDMESKAQAIAKTAASYISSDQGGVRQGMGKGNYANYIDLANAVSLADVWIVDKNLDLITPTHASGSMGMNAGSTAGAGASYTYQDIPTGADELVAKVFQGETAFSEEFSGLLHAPTLTVGAPVKDSSGVVIGVVLLHAPVGGYAESMNQNLLLLLLCVTVALFVAFLASKSLSVKFTKPLTALQKRALHMASGEYGSVATRAQEDEIGDVARAMDTLAVHLQDAEDEHENFEKMRRDFISNVSHELRTPITVLRGSIESLRDGVVIEPDAVREVHEKMLQEALVLQRLVGDLLDLSTLQNVNFSIEKSTVDLCEVFCDAVTSFEYVAQKKGVVLASECAYDHYAVTGDYGRLRQMLMVLLDNAVKFSEPGGTVDVEFAHDEIHVSNHAEGISFEDAEHMFARFYTSGAMGTGGGTGLGLPIAQEIAHRHDMDISVQSVQKDSITFNVRVGRILREF